VARNRRILHMPMEWMNEWTNLCYRHQNTIWIYFSCNQKYKKWQYILWMQRQKWIKSLYNSLTMLPVIILNLIFCILKIFTLCEEFHQNINP
jgi:hypothetical protein